MLACENTARNQIQLEFGLDLFIGICKSDGGSVQNSRPAFLDFGF